MLCADLLPSAERLKFVKVSRLMRPEIGSVYYSEFWTREPPKDFQSRSKPTQVRAGQLRLVRAVSESVQQNENDRVHGGRG